MDCEHALVLAMIHLGAIWFPHLYRDDFIRDAREVRLYKTLVSPFLDRFDSETMHEATRKGLHLAESTPAGVRLVEFICCGGRRFSDPRLATVVGGVQLDNPVMVGAGWDKSGISVRGLHAMGFSGIEVGSVTAYPQPGNPKPRQWMIAPGVAINRLGFNSPGAQRVAHNLDAYLGLGIPVGISIGKNKDVAEANAPEAHAAVVRALYKYASYFAINVSSPNTPGLRALQEKRPLTEIAHAVIEAMSGMGNSKPVFIKIAPELPRPAIDDVIQIVRDNGLAGIIATNSIADASFKARYGERWAREAGGLSGDDPWFRSLATEIVAYIHDQTGGHLDIIGAGGVKDAATALEKLRAGARAVQMVTAIRGEGPAVAYKINCGIVRWMETNGVRSLEEVVGADARTLAPRE